jgi:hypothetical protein
MPLINVTVLRDHSYLHKKHTDILTGAIAGVRIATEDALDFVKETVVEGQHHVGHPLYPQVKPETARWKAKHGMQKVGRRTGAWVTSFDTIYEDGGLVGIVSGGGHVKGADYTHFQERWKVDELWYSERSMFAREAIAQAVKKAV